MKFNIRLILRLVLIVLIALPVIGVSALWIWAQTAARPTNLGVTAGQLAPCPPTPNCVSTQSTTAEHQMAPLPYTGTLDETKARLRQVVEGAGRATLLTDEGPYVAYLFRSPRMGFPDDVEFYLDDQAKQIHFRAAARMGEGDGGANRTRMEAITQTFLNQ
jgi:uncharacterized protein (DUF1499 family)